MKIYRFSLTVKKLIPLWLSLRNLLSKIYPHGHGKRGGKIQSRFGWSVRIPGTLTSIEMFGIPEPRAWAIRPAFHREIFWPPNNGSQRWRVVVNVLGRSVPSKVSLMILCTSYYHRICSVVREGKKKESSKAKSNFSAWKPAISHLFFPCNFGEKLSPLFIYRSLEGVLLKRFHSSIFMITLSRLLHRTYGVLNALKVRSCYITVLMHAYMRSRATKTPLFLHTAERKIVEPSSLILLLCFKKLSHPVTMIIRSP